MIFSCKVLKPNQSISGVHVKSIMPIIQRDGTVRDYIGLMNVYQFNDHIMYEYGNHFDSSFNQILVLNEYRYSYFVYHKDSLYGMGYEMFHRQSPARILVDSILKEWGHKDMRWSQVLSEPVTDSQYDSRTGILQLLYNRKERSNDSLLFYFDKNLDFPGFSFSPEFDSAKNSKLYKIRIINDTIKDPSYNFILPKTQYLFEMKKLVLKDDSKIRNLFNRYLEGK